MKKSYQDKFLYWIKQEKFVLGIILLSIILLVSTSPGVEKGTSSGVDFSTRVELYKMVNLKEAPPIPAMLFRLLSLIFLTMAVSGIALNIQSIAGRYWRLFPPGPSPPTYWGIWPVIKVAVYFIFILLLFQRLETSLFSVFGFGRLNVNYFLLLVNAFFQFAILIILVVTFLEKFCSPGIVPVGETSPGRGTPARILGVNRKEWSRSIRQALRGYIIFFPALIILIIASLAITRLLGIPFQTHPLVQPLLEAGKTGLICPLFAVGILMGPLAEELFFRGLLFPALKRRLSVSWSVVISAALFSTLHLNWAGWLPIFGLGILLAYSYERTGSILVPVFIHVIHNGLFLTFAVLVFKISA
ncbi:MAG: CPBP family intramembrane metalloprotease [Candidatus Euphemobacter frigidus]|nr:CPBP family intramembrane metalloprotease [Candidatus Euphemobacter frigidus]MDP8275833.1 CPBP family intramembrane metalloprotease [Candidatus Euphemobacter frigidus]